MHRDLGQQVLRAEAEAIVHLSGKLGTEFEAAVDAILANRGRLIIMGMGKSGHVGSKMAATFASTGTPTHFVHAGEALHGDLGMVTREDLVIAISNSGETAEVLGCLPSLWRIGARLIAMTGRGDSTLARAAEIVLDYGKWQEADSLNLAPTTSTTVTLALGDALAAAVMSAKGFTKEQFAVFHPGGALGARLLGGAAAEVAAAVPVADPAPEAQPAVAPVVVFGSFMMDLVVKTPRRPVKGETLMGDDFGLFPGGKGFNQAVAAARQGAPVAMIGRLGDDTFGSLFRQAMKSEGIDQRFVLTDESVGTGVGTPVIDAEGDNSIIIVPRANLRCTAKDADRAAATLQKASVLVLQREIPEEVSLHAARLAAAAGVKIIYNPAPAPTGAVCAELLRLADLVIPNEVEAGILAGQPVSDLNSAVAAGEKILAQGARTVVMTLGSRGVLWMHEGRAMHFPAFTVDPVDTTGAGDAFIGTLAARLALGDTIETALVWASAGGALATTKLGALPSMPAKADIDAFLQRQNRLVLTPVTGE